MNNQPALGDLPENLSAIRSDSEHPHQFSGDDSGQRIGLDEQHRGPGGGGDRNRGEGIGELLSGGDVYVGGGGEPVCREGGCGRIAVGTGDPGDPVDSIDPCEE